MYHRAGDRPRTQKDIDHQALQIATMSKMNGGAMCGRVHPLVTSTDWPQRAAFLDALRAAISEKTPATGSYYPGSNKVLDGFKDAYPQAEVLKPENAKFPDSDFMLVPDTETEVRFHTLSQITRIWETRQAEIF